MEQEGSIQSWRHRQNHTCGANSIFGGARPNTGQLIHGFGWVHRIPFGNDVNTSEKHVYGMAKAVDCDICIAISGSVRQN